MRSKTLRWIILSTSLLTGAIIIIQLVWLQRVYSLEQKNFNVNVLKAIRGLYEDVPLINSNTIRLQALIEHPANDLFIARLDQPVSKDTLSYYLKQELEDFDVMTDAHLFVFEPNKTSYNYTSYISTVASVYSEGAVPNITVKPADHSLMALYFPHRKNYVLSQMKFWFLSSGLLLIVLIGLSVSLFFFYRQKFLGELQKEFVNNFTHEFKTPLAVMRIATDVLQEENIRQNAPRFTNYSNILKEQTIHLEHQVEQLLKAAKIDQANIPLEKTTFSVKELIEQAIRKIAPLAESKKATIQWNDLENDTQILADKSHIEMALINLIENGLKYSKEPKIIISLQNKDKYIWISIKDNGIGIEKKYHKKIFQKFFRIPTGNVHDVKGFGIGLNFVKKIIDAHGGQIEVNSIEGIGTEFRIGLPIENHLT